MHKLMSFIGLIIRYAITPLNLCMWFTGYFVGNLFKAISSGFDVGTRDVTLSELTDEVISELRESIDDRTL